MSERNTFSFNYASHNEERSLDSWAVSKSQTQKGLDYHLSWGAAPIAGSEYYDVGFNQANVVLPMLAERVENNMPSDMPDPLRQFIVRAFRARFIARDMKNYDAHSERLVKTAPRDISTTFYEQHDRAMRGLAMPEELMIVRRTLGMKAIGLAQLTHPNGVMIDQLDSMREAVATAVEQQGGIIFEPKDYNEQYKLRSTDLLMSPERHDEAMGLLMTRRRMTGMVEDDTAILERSSFVIPIYPGSKFDPVLSRRMRRVPVVNNEYRMQQLEEAGDLKRVVPDLLRNNDFSAAIPLSTTIFEFNKTVRDEIEAQRKLNKPTPTRKSILQLMKSEKNYLPRDLEIMTENYNSETQEK